VVREERADDRYLRIGELSRRSGVRAELLRAWEERYRLLSPSRTAGGFRLYGADDEQRVRLMLQHLAVGIAAAEAAQLVLAEHVAAVSAPNPRSSPPLAVDGELRLALDGFDDVAAHAALDRAFSAFGLDATLREIIVPFLQELGERWSRGSASIAQEHFATALLRGRLLGLARGWGSGLGPLAVLACVPGDEHDLGLICFALALRERGWRIAYLGPNTPTETTADAARRMRANLVVLAASDAALVSDSEQGIQDLARATPLALGGNGASAYTASRLGAQYLADDPVSAAATVAQATARSIKTDGNHPSAL
jgi:DNA-binding transcriptional MerR regulator/methylmalonyl-CoA mutase cobalamin-binding subunit